MLDHFTPSRRNELLYCLQLLRQVVTAPQFLDGMDLRFEEVRMMLLVMDYAFEQALGAGVTHFLAVLGGVVILPNRVSFVGIVDFELLLYARANLGGQRKIDGGRAIEENHSLNEAFRVMHFLDCTRLAIVLIAGISDDC